jgi:hypothetical protein
MITARPPTTFDVVVLARARSCRWPDRHPAQKLEEFLEACDPVLGQRATEFALVLPPLSRRRRGARRRGAVELITEVGNACGPLSAEDHSAACARDARTR